MVDGAACRLGKPYGDVEEVSGVLEEYDPVVW